MFVYGVTTVGATVHLHFCMDKFVGWTLTQTENTTCKKCGMKENVTKKGCCKDEEKQLKIDSDQQKSAVESFINNVPFSVINDDTFTYNFTSSESNTRVKNIFYSPPLHHTTQKRTILYCTYRI